MRSILFVSVMNGSAWGGSEELWYKLALFCARNGHNTGVVCFNWPGKANQLQQLKEAGCQLYLLHSERSYIRKIKNIYKLKDIPFELYDVQLVSQGGWKDVVHGPFTKLFKRLNNYVLLSHNYDKEVRLSASKKKMLRHWVEKAKCNAVASSKICITVSSAINMELPRSEVWINPITFQPSDTTPEYKGEHFQSCIWVVLAALDVHRKAQDVLIRTLSTDKWKHRNWQLHLYGEGHDKQLLQQLIEEKNLSNKVFLKGHTDNVMQVLEQAHWLLHCTNKDAMPISVMEAMAAGRPALVSNVGDMPEWVSDGFNGFICHTVTEKSIDEQLERIWKSKELWDQMGAHAFQTFKEKYPEPYELKILQVILDRTK